MVEFEQFGWNWVTFGFIGAMATALLGFWGIIEQNRTIWKTKSGHSVSVLMFSYGMLYFTAGCVYGVTICSLALIVMVVRVLLQIPLLIGLWKFKGFRLWETALSALFLVALAAMIVLPHKDIFYFVISIGAIISFVPQPVEMLVNHSRGAMNVSFLWVTVIGVAFWSVYSIAIHDWVLSIANPVFLLFVIASIIIWYAMPPAKTEIADDRAA